MHVPVRAILGIYARENRPRAMIFPDENADPDPTDGPGHSSVPPRGKDGQPKPNLQAAGGQ